MVLATRLRAIVVGIISANSANIRWLPLALSPEGFMSVDTLTAPDILRAARYMIERYGAVAMRRADARTIELARDDQRDAALIWIRITEAMRALEG
jgi:hypothetical protein